MSIDDVLSELFGDIGDEMKAAEAGPERLPDGAVRLPGSMRLDEANQWVGARWESDATTVGGFILNRIGRLPLKWEQLRLDGVPVTIEELGPTSIRWVVVAAPTGMPTTARMRGNNRW